MWSRQKLLFQSNLENRNLGKIRNKITVNKLRRLVQREMFTYVRRKLSTSLADVAGITAWTTSVEGKWGFWDIDLGNFRKLGQDFLYLF